ncbi:MAG: serine protease [Methylocystis sp.]
MDPHTTGLETHLIADFSNGDFPTIQKYPHPIQTSVMPVIAYRGRDFVPLGTCFAISNHGLALTARHIIDEFQAIAARGDDSNPWWIGSLYAADPAPHHDVPGTLGGILPARKIHLNHNLDIAVIHLHLPTDTVTKETLRMPAFKISPGLPKAGWSCFAVGYHSMEWKGCSDADAEVFQKFSASRGQIRQLHTPCRDSAVLNFPCFETSARFDGGMSGGPILAEDGGVIGVVCSSLGSPDDGGYISYGSLIGPALFVRTEAKLDNGSEEEVFLYDFVTGGAVVADHTLASLRANRGEKTLHIDFGDGVTFVGDLG